MKTARRYIEAGDGFTPRANIPGILHIPQSNVIAAVAPRDTFDGTGDNAGRVLYAVGGYSGSMSTTPGGIYLVDITGPWR